MLMDQIELRKVKDLKPHPLNEDLFGNPKESAEYEEILASIKKSGILEPLIILEDGTILSGQLRWTAKKDIVRREVMDRTSSRGEADRAVLEAEVPIRVHAEFKTKVEEYAFVLDLNHMRRQFALERKVYGYDRIKQIAEEASDQPTEATPTPKKGGRPKKQKTESPKEEPKSSKEAMLEEYAAKMGISVEQLDVLSDIFHSPIVPREYKEQLSAETISSELIQRAIKYAIDTAHRERRAPTEADFLVFMEHPEPPKKRNVKALIESIVGSSPSPTETTTEAPAALTEPSPTVAHRISDLRQEFDSVLREADLGPETQAELSALYSRLQGFLSNLGLVPKASPDAPATSLPESLEGRIALLSSVVEGLEEVDDPETVRDLLLDLAMKAKDSAGRLTQAKRTIEPNGLLCSVCHEPQFKTLQGEVCPNGHGGAPGITPESLIPKEEPPGTPINPSVGFDVEGILSGLDGIEDFDPDGASPTVPPIQVSDSDSSEEEDLFDVIQRI
jgi:hypothetical protein